MLRWMRHKDPRKDPFILFICILGTFACFLLLVTAAIRV